jgi:hypothetical protein
MKWQQFEYGHPGCSYSGGVAAKAAKHDRDPARRVGRVIHHLAFIIHHSDQVGESSGIIENHHGFMIVNDY